MNPLLQRMGYQAHDRVVIVHADDIGMCHASTALLDSLFGAGIVTSASVMVPCAWFATAAAWCRAHPNADVGVHFTLTSEWLHYRWGSVATHASGHGLHDAEGYFHRDTASVFAQADRVAAAHELATQYQRAVAFGMQPSHCDSHMGSVFGPGMFEAYMTISQQHRVPVFVPRLTVAQLEARGYDETVQQYQLEMLARIEAQGAPICDHLAMLPLHDATFGVDDTIGLVTGVAAGLTYLIGHPCQESDELKAIAPDWAGRVRDYAVMTDPTIKAAAQAAGVHLIGWRDIVPYVFG